MRTHGTVQKGSDIPDTKSDIPDIKSDTDRTKHRTLPDTQTGHAPDIHRTSPDITGHTGHPVTQGSELCPERGNRLLGPGFDGTPI